MTSVKKNLTTVGYVTIDNKHPFSKGKNGFQISPKLQELMVYSGTLDTYESCHEVINKFIQVEVSSTQVHRVTTLYGEEVGKTINEDVILTPSKKDEVMYAMADGSMIFTREEGWKEAKVGRIFKSSDCIHAGDKPGWISNSQYVAHLGGHIEFTKQMEKLLDTYITQKQQIIFISDGAKWIKNWIEDAYPSAISVLDYYHAVEYLYGFANTHFTEDKKKQPWVEKQKTLLMQSKVKQVIKNVKGLKSSKQEANSLIEYYQNNQARMDYAYYQTLGIGLIGSGAIESTHRTLIQERMKLSGQRWSNRGAKNMLNLRVTRMNKQWSKIITLTKTDFVKSAA